MLRALAAAALGLFIATPAFAINVTECGDDATANVGNIAEPWEKNTRTFYSGNVRVALIDTGGEPVCCSMHLLIIVPVPSEDTGVDPVRRCYLVHNTEGMGFVGIDFARMASSYDAAKGLLITFPYELYNEGNPGPKGVGRVRINVIEGTAVAE
jgi:hypothetical protein